MKYVVQLTYIIMHCGITSILCKVNGAIGVWSIFSRLKAFGNPDVLLFYFLRKKTSCLRTQEAQKVLQIDIIHFAIHYYLVPLATLGWFNLQGVPIENCQTYMAVEMKRCIFDPMVVKPKWFWDEVDIMKNCKHLAKNTQTSWVWKRSQDGDIFWLIALSE